MDTNTGAGFEVPEQVGALTYGGEYDENGVDVSLIRYMLGLSPLERIVRMQEHAKQCWALYELGRRHCESQSAKTR